MKILKALLISLLLVSLLAVCTACTLNPAPTPTPEPTPTPGGDTGDVGGDTPAHTHTEGEWIVDAEATCSEAGSKHTECTECGETVTTETVPAIGHTEGDWIVDSEPTCTEDGSAHKNCTVCGEITTTQVNPALGHKISVNLFCINCGCKANYSSEVVYDWEALFTDSNAVAEANWNGTRFAMPAADWSGTVSMWRVGPDAYGEEMYTYDPEEHAVTIKWNGKNWNALQVLTGQNEAAPLLTAKAAFIAFQVYFPDDGSFPGLDIFSPGIANYAKISPEGLFKHSYEGVLVGHLQPGWNWITIIGIQECDKTGTPNDFRLYFSMLDPHDGFTAEQLVQMPSANKGWAGYHEGQEFRLDAITKGTVDAPTEITFKGLTLGTLELDIEDEPTLE